MIDHVEISKNDLKKKIRESHELESIEQVMLGTNQTGRQESME